MNNLMYEFKPDDFELIAKNQDDFVDESYAKESYWKDIFMRFIKNKGAIIGLIFIILIVIMAAAGPGMNEYTFDSQIISHQNLAPRVKSLENLGLGIFDGAETMNTCRYAFRDELWPGFRLFRRQSGYDHAEIFRNP